jgi:hypothetical protein
VLSSVNLGCGSWNCLYVSAVLHFIFFFFSNFYESNTGSVHTSSLALWNCRIEICKKSIHKTSSPHVSSLLNNINTGSQNQFPLFRNINMAAMRSCDVELTIGFPLSLQPQFGPWPTSIKTSVSLQFTKS